MTPTRQPCAYCGCEDDLRRNVFFSHPVCAVCVREWYEAGRDLTPAELRILSRLQRDCLEARV